MILQIVHTRCAAATCSFTVVGPQFLKHLWCRDLLGALIFVHFLLLLVRMGNDSLDSKPQDVTAKLVFKGFEGFIFL